MDDAHTMPESWQHKLIDRLVAGANQDGAWGYQPGAAAGAEPTAMAALALAAHDRDPDLRERAVSWLAKLQQPDGAVPVWPGLSSPCWPTGLAALAWLRAGRRPLPDGRGSVEEIAAQRAAAWLLNNRGIPVPSDPRIFGHDTTLQGWPWVQDTHSWVEPTGYAILALRAGGKAQHPRVREGVRLLLDRAIPDGGWNYGNTRVIDNTLRPFPAPTGVALTAMADEPANDRIHVAVDYLRHELQGVRAPFSLGWGLIGLSAWGARPEVAQRWLEESATLALKRRPDHLYDAVLLLAGARRRLLTSSIVGAEGDRGGSLKR